MLPMAGEGNRFRAVGINTPKPLLDLGGLRMFELVLTNLVNHNVRSVTLVARKEFCLKAEIPILEKKFGRPFQVIEVDKTTGGPAESVLLAESIIETSGPVVIANSDQFVEFDVNIFYSVLLGGSVSGAILTMQDSDPKWSYVQIDERGNAVRVVEKEVVSDQATVGIYGFANAGEMFSAISEMNRANDRVSGELYLAPSYNYLSRACGPVQVVDLGPVGHVMHGLGTPLDLDAFLAKGRAAVFIEDAKRRMVSE